MELSAINTISVMCWLKVSFYFYVKMQIFSHTFYAEEIMAENRFFPSGIRMFVSAISNLFPVIWLKQHYPFQKIKKFSAIIRSFWFYG